MQAYFRHKEGGVWGQDHYLPNVGNWGDPHIEYGEELLKRGMTSYHFLHQFLCQMKRISEKLSFEDKNN